MPGITFTGLKSGKRACLRPFLLALLLSACNNTSITTKTDVALPAWFYDPSFPGYVGVTASAPPQSIGGVEGQRRAALLMARAEMARMQGVQVTASSKTTVTSSKTGVQFSNADMRRLGTTQLLQLNNAEIKQEWVHPATGELYLWLVFPVSH